MLKLNISRLFKARGIENPYRYLMEQGFTAARATRFLQGRISRIDLRQMERFCLMLGCAPHDLLEWIPNASETNNITHPLNALKRTGSVTNLMQTLNSVPINKLGEIQELIAAKVKEE